MLSELKRLKLVWKCQRFLSMFRITFATFLIITRIEGPEKIKLLGSLCFRFMAPLPRQQRGLERVMSSWERERERDRLGEEWTGHRQEVIAHIPREPDIIKQHRYRLSNPPPLPPPLTPALSLFRRNGWESSPVYTSVTNHRIIWSKCNIMKTVIVKGLISVQPLCVQTGQGLLQ